ncbi:transposable element Tcb1 transposase [Trichonephila clavipes]|nr:transposable element Tcb1 transposase [Trichonephila clavipes]
MRICHHWMQEERTDYRVRSHISSCTTAPDDRWIVCMTVMDRAAISRTIAQQIQFLTHLSMSARTIRRHFQQSGMSKRRVLICLHLTEDHWCLRYQCPHCICHEKPKLHLRGAGACVLPYIQSLPSVLFQQGNARPQVARNVQEFFFTHQIQFLRWPACYHNLSPIENVWSMFTYRLARDTSPVVTPDQLWQPHELDTSKDTSKVSLILCRGHGGPVQWPVRSHDLSCTDFFFFRGHMKNLVYMMPVSSFEGLIARISAAAWRIRDMPGISQNVRNSTQSHYETYQMTSGRNFEHHL